MTTESPNLKNPPLAGLLPLYVDLYDQTLPSLRGEVEPFIMQVVKALERLGIQVVHAPICCTHEQVAAALRTFEVASVHALLTLHLAYSPSLESADELCAFPRPLILLDITPDKDFGQDVDPIRLLRNHGIHGVQDLASVLHRREKRYDIVTGHLDNPEIPGWIGSLMRSAQLAAEFRDQRILRIGPAFDGMGDFQVEERNLREAFGISVDTISPLDLAGEVLGVTEASVWDEMAADKEAFVIDAPEAVHARSVRLGLGLRQYLVRGGYDAFSLNFLAFDSSHEPISTVPFLECCKAMARGTGYAGEGDVLTAALVGALQRTFGQTTFTEMFCADWKGDSLFLSHMGEVNPECAPDKPVLYEKDYPFTPAMNPATLACSLKPGPATLVNLAPGPEDSFRLILAPVEVLGDGTHPDLKHWIRAWIRPASEVRRFLRSYSMWGGTHHCALVMGDEMYELDQFGEMLGVDVTSIY
jgi:L-arabinose isomerase